MEKVVRKSFGLILMLLIINTYSFAQVILPPLERPITIDLTGESTKEALKKIEKEADFYFAYRTDLVDQTNSMTRAYISKTVREVLDDIFQGSVLYKEKGNYVVLKSSPVLKEQEISLEGYVIDSKTGIKVPYASIYDSITLASAVSDEYGHYQLKLSTEQTIRLSTRKLGYLDTSFVWAGVGTKVLNIKIDPIVTEEPELEEDTMVIDIQDSSNFITRLKNLKLFKPSEEQKANIINFKEKFQKKAQFSILPSIGTNGGMSPNISVDYSFNLLGGFNGGVRKFEVGGLFNVVWDSVSYFQAAGLFNSVGGPQRGFQGAGLANVNSSTFNGFQGAGLFNFTLGEVRGVQMAGLVNATGSRVNGFQGAGLWNQNIDSSTVVQVAGFGNLTGKSTNGTQVASFINLAGKNYKGAQISGVANIANDNFKGTQVAGFINIAKNITGSQIGFINISDSLNGVPIGFISFCRKGVHQLEISSNEIMPVNLAFKTGSYQFYNSFLAGMRFKGTSSPYWSFGYGIGSSVRTGNRSRVYFDLQSVSIQRGGIFNKSLLNKLTASYQFNFSKNVALAVGPSFNVFLVDQVSSDSGAEMNALAPYSIYDRSFGSDGRLNAWIGGHIALRLF